ncbi:MAG TPA: glycosyltransferase family 39 protein [Armatimonadota bacterium]|jgi:4-amino-4-deoxy-L-arabinose transferase-like glycosyltransferase
MDISTNRSQAPSEGVIAEPSEARVRALLLGLLMVAGPPLLLILYARTMFPGLTNSDALDFAQLGRNLASGHGFVTNILRPLAITSSANVQHLPDVTHGPLYPLMLALAFGALGAKDAVAAGVSSLFYLLTIPVVYRLGLRAFGRTVGIVAALIFTVNALMLEYALSGLHATLYIFLTTCLFLALYDLGSHWLRVGAEAPAPRGKLLKVGALSALLYLTEPVFFWALPVVAAAVVYLSPRRKGLALLWFGVALVVLAAPWMLRNAALTGNPIFGVKGKELWMYTSVYPLNQGYRMSPQDLVPSLALFKSVIRKVLQGVGEVLMAFPQTSTVWVLAFFLPSLFFRFRDPVANGLRRTIVGFFAALALGGTLFTIKMPLFVSLIPAILVFSVAYLLYLVGQAQLNRGAVTATALLVAFAVVYPLAQDTMLTDKTPPIREAEAAKALGRRAAASDVVLSDQPWIVAWYANRPALWLPVREDRLEQLRGKLPETRWVFLTQMAQSYSPNWAAVFGQLVGMNQRAVMARNSGQPIGGWRFDAASQARPTPLARALNGLTWVPPDDPSQLPAGVASLPKLTSRVAAVSEQLAAQ